MAYFGSGRNCEVGLKTFSKELYRAISAELKCEKSQYFFNIGGYHVSSLIFRANLPERPMISFAFIMLIPKKTAEMCYVMDISGFEWLDLLQIDNGRPYKINSREL